MTPKPGMEWPRPDLTCAMDLVLEEAPAEQPRARVPKPARPRRRTAKRKVAAPLMDRAKCQRVEPEHDTMEAVDAEAEDDEGTFQAPCVPQPAPPDEDYDVFGFNEE